MVERSNLQLARRLAITSTTLPLLIRIGEWFGGKIHPHTPPRNDRTRQQFQWYTGGDHARAILHGILPYLIVKKEEAEIYLAFDGRTGTHVSSSRMKKHEKEFRATLLARIQSLRRAAWTEDQIPPALSSRKATTP